MTTPRRRRQWIDNLMDVDLASGQQTSVSLVDVPVPDTKGMTLVRVILGFNVRPSTPVLNSTDTQVFSAGIGLSSADAASASAFADPDNESDQPLGGWMWRWQGLIHENPVVPTRIELDLRSQRKLMYGDVRIIMDNNADQGAAFTIIVVGLIRSLYLLP